MSNAASPVLVGTYDTPDYAQGIDVVLPYAYVADRDSGLVVVRDSPSKETGQPSCQVGRFFVLR